MFQGQPRGPWYTNVTEKKKSLYPKFPLKFIRNSNIWKNKVYFVLMKIPKYGVCITNHTSQENSLSKFACLWLCRKTVEMVQRGTYFGNAQRRSRTSPKVLTSSDLSSFVISLTDERSFFISSY